MGSSDPVLSLLKDFSYNVVRLPRTGIKPLQILEKQDNDLVVLGEVSDLFKAGNAALPPVGPDEQATFINGKRTRDLKISVGLSLLGNIVGAMTGTKVKLDLGYKKASALAFEFHDVKLNSINQLQLSKFLTAAKIDETVGPPAKLLEADKLYLITSVVKSKKFTAEALKDGGVSVDVDVPIIKAVVGAEVGVKTAAGSNSKITYEGDTPLVFGFQAVRMEFEKGAFKGFKQVGAGSSAMRAVGQPARETAEPQFEILETDGPFANFFNPLPEEPQGGAKKSQGKSKQAAQPRGSKKSGAKKSARTVAPSGGSKDQRNAPAKGGTKNAATKGGGQKQGAKKATKRGQKGR